MYLRPANSAPQPLPANLPSSTTRFYDLLDALKMEYELASHANSHSDATNKMSAGDYEVKVHHQIAEMTLMQKTILELEKAFLRMKQEYEDEIARLKRGDELSEDHRPLLPTGNAGHLALAGLQHSFAAEKRTSSVVSIDENHLRHTRPRESSSGAISDIATAAIAASAPTATHTPTTLPASTGSAYDWLVTYNPKVPRLLSLDLAQSMNFEGGVVCCVRFNSAGTLLAASGNKLCVIYDTQTGQKIASLPHFFVDGGDLYVRSLSFSPSDKIFATGSEDNLIRIWDTTTFLPGQQPKHVRTLKGHVQDVYALQFVDENTLVSGSGDQTLRMWDLSSESEDCCKSCISLNSESDASIESGITSLDISHDRKYVVTGSLDRLVRVYSLASDTFTLVQIFDGHADSVYSVVFDRDDKAVISGSLDKTIRRWIFSKESTASTSTAEHQIISGHKDFVLSVSVTSQHRPFIISGSKDRTVQFWDEIGETLQLTLQGHKNSVISVAVSHSGGIFATGSGDGRARIWTISEKSE